MLLFRFDSDVKFSKASLSNRLLRVSSRHWSNGNGSEDTTTINAVSRWFARFAKETRTSKTILGRDAPKYIVEDSAALDAVEKNPEAVPEDQQQHSDVPNRQLKAAPNLSSPETADSTDRTCLELAVHPHIHLSDSPSPQEFCLQPNIHLGALSLILYYYLVKFITNASLMSSKCSSTALLV